MPDRRLIDNLGNKQQKTYTLVKNPPQSDSPPPRITFTAYERGGKKKRLHTDRGRTFSVVPTLVERNEQAVIGEDTRTNVHNISGLDIYLVQQ